MVSEAIEAHSGPFIAKRSGLGTQAIYNYRDGRLPSRLAIPALARGLRVSTKFLAEVVAEDEQARARAKAGAA